MNFRGLKIVESLFALLLIAPIVTSSQTSKNTSYPEYYKGKAFEAIIFHLDTTENGGCFDSKKFVVPNKKNIDEYELQLQTQFSKINADYAKEAHWKLSDKQLSNYKRQVAGYIDKNGDEILFISGAHSSLNKTNLNYKEYFICSPMQLANYSIESGYTPIDWWGIKYNCRTRKFFDFIIFDPS